jgi:hypothetical protein
MKTTSFALAVGAICVLAVGAFAATVPDSGSQWRIDANGNAESSGEILIRVTPQGEADAIEVPVGVSSGNDAAAIELQIRDALKTHLAPNRFDVTQNDAGEVILTPDPGQPNFSVQVVTSDVPTVNVIVRRDEKPVKRQDSQPQSAEPQLPESASPDR